jgi:hypothetical protein
VLIAIVKGAKDPDPAPGAPTEAGPRQRPGLILAAAAVRGTVVEAGAALGGGLGAGTNKSQNPESMSIEPLNAKAFIYRRLKTD